MFKAMFEKKFLINTASVESVCSFIMDNIPDEIEIDQDTLNDIILAADEAASNIIIHACKNVCKGYFRLSVIYHSDRIIVSLFDTGVTFDPNEVPEPILSDDINTRQIGGLGLFIMQKILDKVNYIAKGPGNPENEIRLTKLLKSAS